MAPRPTYLQPTKDDLPSFRKITATALVGQGSFYCEQHNHNFVWPNMVSTRWPRVRINLPRTAITIVVMQQREP